MKMKSLLVTLTAPKARPWEVGLELVEKYFALIGRRLITPAFQKVWEYSFVQLSQTKWMGIRALKKPQDFWVYQEIIWETRPDLLIETGTCQGGSAMFFASVFDLLGKGRVITIDVDPTGSKSLSHHRITALVGSSVSDSIVGQVKEMVGSSSVMVSLDSNHSKEHVLREMEIFSDFVSPGNYMVVEDTGIKGRGPGEAVKAFLKTRQDFVVDKSREKFMITSCHGGFLRKV